jgi:hypothetical protein
MKKFKITVRTHAFRASFGTETFTCEASSFLVGGGGELYLKTINSQGGIETQPLCYAPGYWCHIEEIIEEIIEEPKLEVKDRLED